MDEILYELLLGFPTVLLLGIIFISINTLGKGADVLVDEAVNLSNRWGVSKTIIGATVVSLGTTIPEVTVSVMAALKGSGEVALGNAVGSIITNTSLILGLAAIIGAVPVSKKILKRQGIVQIISAVFLVIVSQSFISQKNISKPIGFLLLLGLGFYTYLTIKWSKDNDYEEDFEVNDKPIYMILFKFILGALIVVISSKVLIPTVEITAIRVGIPQSIVAATLVAFGTSLPELVTSIKAVRQGHGELAVGNVVGANILNVLFVVGLASSVSKDGLLVPEIFYKLQYPAMLIVLLTFHLLASSKEENLNRKSGMVLLGMYAVYLGFNISFI